MHSISLSFILSLAFHWLSAVECSPLGTVVSRGDCRVLTEVTYWGIACQKQRPVSCQAGQSYGGVVSFNEKTTFPADSVPICEQTLEVSVMPRITRSKANISTSTNVALGRWVLKTSAALYCINRLPTYHSITTRIPNSKDTFDP